MEERRLAGAQQLEKLLREAEVAHGAYETSLGRRDENWPAWYARYIFERLPEADYPPSAAMKEDMPSTEPYLSD